ncbi:hypothetical protein [Lentzea atacamensis]|nr:hypothetical protein [Lentzea atacamensis]
MTYDVTFTELASTVTCHQRVNTTAAGIASAVGRGLQDLYEFAARAAVTPAGPPQLSCPDPAPGRELDLDLHLLQISGRPEKSGDIDVVVLPEGPVAQTFHHGRYDEIGAAYEAPARELYLTGPDTATVPDDCLTEVVVPLRRN